MKTKVLLTALLLLSSLSIWAQLPSYLPANGLVAWYPFNGNANDESGNGNNGIVNNAELTLDRFTNPNAAYAFSTSNSYIQLPFTSLQQYTFSIWVYDTNIADTSDFITSTNLFGPTGTNDIYHSINNGVILSEYSIPLTFPHGRGYGISTPLDAVNLNWKHIAITYDGLTIKQFIDGVLSASGSPGVAALGNNIGNILISGIQNSFNGKLDDFGFWNRALTQQEIASLYTVQAPCINPTISLTNAPTCSVDLLSYSLSVNVSSGTVTSTGGTVTNTQGNNWLISGVPSGTDIVLTASSGNCTETLTIFAPSCNCPAIENAISLGDRFFCAGTTIPNLGVQVAAGIAFDWYNAASGGSILATNTNYYSPSTMGVFYVQARDISTGCTSSTRTAINLIENALPVVTESSDQVICTGETAFLNCAGAVIYEWTGTGLTSFSGSTVNALGLTAGSYTYTVTGSDGNGCSSHAEINVVVNQPSATTETESACGSYAWKGNTYTQSGAYTWTGTNAAGCDSVVTLNLTIFENTTSTIEVNSCGPYEWNGIVYSKSGAYTHLNSCASQTLLLHINEITEVNAQINLGESYDFNGNAYSETGVYYDTILRATNCDSIVKLNLIVNQNSECGITTSNDSVCFFQECELRLMDFKPSIFTIKPELIEYAWGGYDFNFNLLTPIPAYGLISGIGNFNSLEVGVVFGENELPNLANALMVEYTFSQDGKFGVNFNPDFNIDVNKIYYYRAFYIAGEDTVFSQNYQALRFYSNEQFNPRIEYGELKDIDGNNYKTVNIGNQCWMAENLKTNLFSNGDSLTNDISQSFPQAGNGFYNHPSIQDERNVCPVGTHVPSNEEWSTLFNYTINDEINYNSGVNTATALQSNLLDNFSPTYFPRTNSSGFSANTLGDYYEVFWSSTPYDSIQYEGKKIVFYRGTLFSPRAAGLSDFNTGGVASALNRIRCLSDAVISENQFPLILTTQALSQINDEYEITVELQNDNNAELFEKGVIVSTYTSINGLSIGLFPEIDETPFPYVDDFKIIKAGSNAENFSLALENLLPNMKYYTRAYVKNRFGVRYGEELTFTTSSQANQVLWSTGETTPTISVFPSETTTYSVTVTQGTQICTSDVTITVNQPSATTEAVTACGSYNWNGTTYTQSGTYTFTGTNAAGCDSVVTLNLTIIPQPAQPSTACYHTATFNAQTCAWVLTGSPAPAIVTNASACESYTWEVNGQTYTTSGNYSFSSNCQDYTLNLIIAPQPPQPPTACYQTATFNSQTCSWVLTGTQPTQPATACYQTATFNNQSCSWVLTGNQPAQPATACYQTATFNNQSCAWVLTGTQPAQPATACYQTATFNNQSCSWVLAGTQPTQPATACYQTATFNNQTCAWELTGTQPAQPATACYQTATFNPTSCSWVVTGSPAPTIVTNASACESYTWEANGQAYSASGEYSFNSNCQDYTLNLTINQATTSTVNANITEGESYSFNGQNLTAAGTYTATLQNAAGCDSTATLYLTVLPNSPTGCYAASVVDFVQGLNSDGLPVEPARSNSTLALGEPETVVEGIVNFASLGFGGSITLAFEAPIANGDGADIRIDEATWGNNPCNRYPETADVFASQDGINFVYLGRSCQDMSLDLGPLSWAQYIRIVDVSDALLFRGVSDGYDVNGIECLNGTATFTTNDGLIACSLQEIVSYESGNRKNGTPIATSRRNPTNALGVPQNNNAINFVALGFGGTLVAKFDYVVFNQPGNDLRVTETSFGNPSCNNYPEKARVSVSMDNVIWTELGEICQDGEIDLGAVNYAQYIKIQDASPISSNKFNGAADGYDIDAVVVLNNGCGTASARLAQMDNTTTPDASLMVSAFPNPMEDYTIVNFEGLENDSDFNFQIMDAAGRVIRSNNIRVSTANPTYLFDASELARGIYQVVIANDNGGQIIRLVK